MPLPEKPTIADPIQEAIERIYVIRDEIGQYLGPQLERIMAITSSVDLNALFARWENEATKSLEMLGDHVGLVAKHYPDRMSAPLLKAGLHLTAHQDGTVTYDPPEPPTPEEPTE